MFEIQIIPALIFFCGGTIVGILATLLFNKMRTGSASAGKIKKEMEDYQGEVEAHFEETSKKFKDMAAQYQDLYQHLSVGATTLCRPENTILGLSDNRDPLAMAPTIEQPAKRVDATHAAGKAVDKKTVDVDSPIKKSAEKSTSSKVSKQPEQKKQSGQSQVKSSQSKSSQVQPNKDQTNTDSSKSKKPA